MLAFDLVPPNGGSMDLLRWHVPLPRLHQPPRASLAGLRLRGEHLIKGCVRLISSMSEAVDARGRRKLGARGIYPDEAQPFNRIYKGDSVANTSPRQAIMRMMSSSAHGTSARTSTKHTVASPPTSIRSMRLESGCRYTSSSSNITMNFFRMR